MSDQQPEVRDIFKAKTEREKSERCHELVTTAFMSMRRTKAIQRRARDFLRGRISAGLPEAIREAAIRHGAGATPGSQGILEYHAPQIMVNALRLVAEFGSKAPQPKRHPVARARESGAVSNRIERVATGVMGQLYPYRQSCDPVLLDSEAATTVIPSTAHWAHPVDQYDYCTDAEWQALPDDLKMLWEWRPNEAEGDAQVGRYRRYSRKYRRDGDGRPEWDDEYTEGGKPFREDTGKSAEAVEEEIETRMRAKIPLQVDLLLPTMFAPVNPRWEGDQLCLDGIARRETYGGTDLYRRGYRWGKDLSALNSNPAYNSIAPVTLDTLLLQDGDGCPYLIYSIDECRTYRQDGDRDFNETIDLHDRYGFDFLPVVYQLGLHTMSSDWDDVVIPMLEPLIVPSLMRDRLVAMNDFHTQQTSCGGWFIKIDPAVQAAMPDLASKPEFKIKQMTGTPIPGDAIPAVHPGAGPGLLAQKEMLDTDLMLASGPQEQDASSGIQLALQGRDENRGMNMAWAAIDGLYAGTATNAVRALACMARKLDKPITLNILTEMPDNDTSSSTKSTVVIDPDMFGGDFRVIAWRPDDWGSDPTRQAMLMQAQKDKQATWTEMREAVGDPDPIGTLAQIFVEDYVMNTSDGKDMVLAEEAKINNDVRALEQAKLRREQLLNAANVPTGFGGGVMDPNAGLMSEQGNGAPSSMNLDVAAAAGVDPAQQSLNAAAGAPQAAVTNIAQAGGDASGLDFSMGGG
jgi:hypothetical protein